MRHLPEKQVAQFTGRVPYCAREEKSRRVDTWDTQYLRIDALEREASSVLPGTGRARRRRNMYLRTTNGEVCFMWVNIFLGLASWASTHAVHAATSTGLLGRTKKISGKGCRTRSPYPSVVHQNWPTTNNTKRSFQLMIRWGPNCAAATGGRAK